MTEADDAAKARRREVVMKYVRKRKDGYAILCKPSDAERAAGMKRSAGKPIYDTKADARAAALGLEELGARPLEPYACHRGSHFHLATRK